MRVHTADGKPRSWAARVYFTADLLLGKNDRRAWHSRQGGRRDKASSPLCSIPANRTPETKTANFMCILHNLESTKQYIFRSGGSLSGSDGSLQPDAATEQSRLFQTDTISAPLDGGPEQVGGPAPTRVASWSPAWREEGAPSPSGLKATWCPPHLDARRTARYAH